MVIQQKRYFASHIARKIFLEDWAMKLLALVITLTLWFFVTGLSTPTTKRLTVPLILNIASTAQIVNTPQQEVDIEIVGDKRKIEQINRGDLAASLDLTEVPPGDRVVSLTPENVFVSLPQGIKLIEVAPSRIAVNLEAVDEKEIEVKAEITGAPATGYEIYDTSVLPPKILVRGPASVVKMLGYVETDRIDISGRREDFTARQVAVSSPNAKAAVLNTVVDVVFHIGEKRVERLLTAPVAGFPEKTASFTIYGPKSIVARARGDLFLVDMVKNENGIEVPHVILPQEMQSTVEARDVSIKTTKVQ